MWINSEEDKANELPIANNQPVSNPSVGAGGSAGAAPGTGSSSSANASTTNAAGPTQGPQKFATVQDYLKTNQPQAEDLGQKVTASLGNTLGTEKNAIDTAASQTQNDINAGITNYNADLTNQALTNPTQVANNPDQLSAFKNQYNATYSGPQSFEASNNYTPAITAANEATTKAGELATEGGREQLLQDQFNVYGQGNKGLDQALLQTSSAFPTIQEQGQNFQSVPDYLKSVAQTTDTAASNAQTATDAAKTATQNAFANNLTSFQTKLNSEVNDARTLAQTNGSAIQNDLASGNGAQLANDLRLAGISSENVPNIVKYLSTLNSAYKSNPDLSNYYASNPATDITAANVATPEEYANADAYKQLTGVDYSGILNPANVSQAGTASTAPKVNTADLQTYLKGQLQQRDNETVTNAPPITPDMPISALEQVLAAANRSGISNDKVKSYQNTYFQRTGRQPADLA